MGYVRESWVLLEHIQPLFSIESLTTLSSTSTQTDIDSNILLEKKEWHDKSLDKQKWHWSWCPSPWIFPWGFCKATSHATYSPSDPGQSSYWRTRACQTPQNAGSSSASPLIRSHCFLRSCQTWTTTPQQTGRLLDIPIHFVTNSNLSCSVMALINLLELQLMNPWNC